MNDYVLTCCSTADLSPAHFEARGIHYVCFHYAVNGEEHMDDLGKSMSSADFYQAIRDGAETRTAQVNISEYLEFFSAFLEKGLDIVHVCLSSGLSGTINSARNAALIAQERFPGRSIHIVDSLGASSGYGLIMDAAADKRDAGMSAPELAAWIEENRLRLHHWFFSTDLSCYVRGGRISKTAAVFGGLLDICPLLDMDAGGHLTPRAKVRGKKRVIKDIVSKMEQNAENKLDYSGKCYISHSDCIEDAQAVAALVEEKFPRLDGKVEINSVGTTIGSHTGPGTVALFFWGGERA